MSAEQEIAAPAQLARIEFVSPWPAPMPAGLARRWLTSLAEAWREGMALYVRAGGRYSGRGGWLG
jgi:hypothetical protein